MKASKSLGILAASAVLFSGAAGAVTLTAGQAATILWSGTYGGAALSASATFQLTSINSTTAMLNVTLANNTLSSQPGTNRLTSFAIDNITPNISGARITQELSDDDDWQARRNTNFPSFQGVELCLYAGSTCSGGSHYGLIEGETDSFVLRLSGHFGNSITFDGFPSKWQAVGVNGRSFEFGGCVVGSNCGGSSVPEPGPLALFGVGLLGLALRQRRSAS